MHLIDALGIGYRYEGSEAVIVVSLQFGSAADAKADPYVRRSLAQQGISQSSGKPYSQLFSLQSVSVVGSSLVLRLYPVQNRPSIVFQLLDNRDLLFAMCP